MNISIFGLGYVGCVSLGCLAKNGHKVIGVDIDINKVDLINKGQPTIIEKDIDKIIQKQWKDGNIRATDNYTEAVISSDISIICVGTPSTKRGHLNLEFIINSAKQIGESLKKKLSFHIIVIRSTVLPGTNQKVGNVIEEISGKKRNEGFAVVSNPEFLREGTAVNDYYYPPVTVLGSDNNEAMNKMTEIYSKVNAPIVKTDIKVAEIIKYINNTFHALKICFANEVGNICKSIQIDSHKVMDLFCMDKKLNISSYYFKPGFAYGGSCLPKDLKALKTIAHDNYIKTPIIETIEDSNNQQIDTAYNIIVSKKKKKVGILGLSFKKGTDDLRNSPIVEITERLIGKGYYILIYDKNVNTSKLTGTNKFYIEEHIPHLSRLMNEDIEKVVRNSEILIITQNEDEFKKMMDKYPNKIYIDLVGIIDKVSYDKYEGICW